MFRVCGGAQMSKRNFDYDGQVWVSRVLLERATARAKELKVSRKWIIEAALRNYLPKS